MTTIFFPSQQVIQSKIENHDFSKLSKYVVKHYPQYAQNIDTFLDEYKNFLLLCAVSKKTLAVPNQAVDDIWHSHLINNADYNPFTFELFGYILLHKPFTDDVKPDVETKQNLIDASFEVFGKNVFTVNTFDYFSSSCTNCSTDCTSEPKP